MKLMVPTLMVKVLLATDANAFGKELKAGEIVEMPYGQALVLKAIGGVKALVDEDLMHMRAQQELSVYGGDSWFAPPQQTIARVADFLATVGGSEGHS